LIRPSSVGKPGQTEILHHDLKKILSNAPGAMIP